MRFSRVRSEASSCEILLIDSAGFTQAFYSLAGERIRREPGFDIRAVFCGEIHAPLRPRVGLLGEAARFCGGFLGESQQGADLFIRSGSGRVFASIGMPLRSASAKCAGIEAGGVIMTSAWRVV